MSAYPYTWPAHAPGHGRGLQVDDDLRGVQDRQGSLFFLVVQGMFGSVMTVLTVFGAEKAVFK